MLNNLQVNEYLYYMSSGFSKYRIYRIFCVIEVGEKRAKVKEVNNLPDGKHHGLQVSWFSITLPRGKAIGRSMDLWRKDESPDEVRKDDLAVLLELENKKNEQENKWNNAVAKAKELYPVLPLVSSTVTNVYTASFELASKNFVAVIMIEENSGRIFNDSEYRFLCRVSGVSNEYGRVGTFSSSGTYGATMEDAIYAWLAGNL